MSGPDAILIDSIARAIYEARNGRGCKPWANLPASHKAPYQTDALAALNTIQEHSNLTRQSS